MGKAHYRVVGNAVVGSILYKGMLVEFVFDQADYETVQKYKWHYSSNSYIATSQRIDVSGQEHQQPQQQAKKRELYLHNLLLQPPAGKIVQHISKNGLDNRRCNLRLVDSASAAAHHTANLTSKKRIIELPPLCGIKAEDIPKHIWYVQANGYHRDRFAIELKSENILWKSTSSKKVSLQEKLEQTKGKLNELYVQYPHLDPKREEEQIAAINGSFQGILTRASAATGAPEKSN